MPAPPDHPDPSPRRARFLMPPPPAGSAGTPERLRLVDPTGNAVAWLGYGERLVVLGFLVQASDGTWRELLRDRVVPVDSPAGGWTLVERDPTTARLRDASGTEVVAGIADGVLVIACAGTPVLVAGPDDRLPPAGPRR
ncbi:MAG TPA: hypothetical protein VNP95_14230 [Thermomicrobiales bacterium]|nr:hypothetical protein [Thermomicrobiales bacterium]